MTTDPKGLYRWAGVANLLAGITLIIHAILHPLGTDAAATQSPLWAPAHAIGYLGFVLGMFGLVGLFARQTGGFGRAGVAGFALAFAGQTMTSGVVYLDSFVAPVLGQNAPALLSSQGPLFSGPAGLIVIIAALLVTIGYIVFGVATYRTGILPKGGALLIVFGSWFGFAAAFSPVGFAAGAIIFGVGNAWLGYGLYAHPG